MIKIRHNISGSRQESFQIQMADDILCRKQVAQGTYAHIAALHGNVLTTILVVTTLCELSIKQCKFLIISHFLEVSDLCTLSVLG